MMPSNKEQLDKLERAIAQAHQTQEAPNFTHSWLQSVMREVRQQAVRVTPAFEVPFLVWRAAAVVAIISLIFVGSVLTWNAGQADDDFTALFAEATVDMTLTGEL
jgi:hypothetical protein